MTWPWAFVLVGLSVCFGVVRMTRYAVGAVIAYIEKVKS